MCKGMIRESKIMVSDSIIILSTVVLIRANNRAAALAAMIGVKYPP